MSLIEIAALLGASAWLYPIFIEGKKLLKKSIINFYPSDKIGISYTTDGPILSLQGTIVTENAETVLLNMEIETRHIGGDSRAFKWAWLSETQFHFRSYSGEGGSLEKSQTATALKLDPYIQIDKTVMFNEPKYLEKIQGLYAKLAERIYKIQYYGAEGTISELFSNDEYIELESFFKGETYWKPGHYKAILKIYTKFSKGPFCFDYEFDLIKEQIAFLDTNTNMLRAVFETPNIQPKWNWIYSRLIKAE